MRVGAGAPAALGLALLAAPALAAGGDAALALSCRGEEPFWGLEARAGGATLTRPGEGDLVLRGRLDDLAWLPPGWLVWRSEGPGPRLVATLRAETCRSAMADDAPPGTHRVVLVEGDRPAAAGCCTVTSAAGDLPIADAAAKPVEDWSRLLPDLLPGLRRCLAVLGSDWAAVVAAWPMNHGLIGARLRESEGESWDCVAEATGQGIARLEVVRPDSPPLRSEGDPIFLLDRGQPPPSACARTERVLDAADRLAGWLRYGC